MAYFDVGTADYGTYTSWLIAEPGSPITHAWGSSIALALTRLVKCGYATVQCLGTAGYSDLALNKSNRFQKLPFIKIYRGYGGTFNDYRTTGDGNDFNFAAAGVNEDPTTIGFYDNTGVDSLYVRWGTENGVPPSQLTHTIFIIASGR